MVETDVGQIKRHIDQLLQNNEKMREVREEKVKREKFQELRKTKICIKKPKKICID